jgi:hypothetical protein
VVKPSQKLDYCLKNGVYDKSIDQLIQFNLFMAAKKIMRMKKEDRQAAINTIPSIFHSDIKSYALKINRYFTSQQKGRRIGGTN